MTEWPEHYHYFVTDIELDGPDPDAHSMLSFATCVVRSDGEILGDFSAVLETLPGRKGDPDTMNWWATQPEAWKAARHDPQSPESVMTRFADWVETVPMPRVFASRPLMLDGLWMDFYLHRFAQTRIFDGPFAGRQIFHGAGLDISSYIKGLFGHSTGPSTYMKIPTDWLGDIEHTHNALDDARGYANLLGKRFGIANAMPKHELDFLDLKQ